MSRREPRCTHNHDAMRRELRDKQLPPTPCPTCDWLLSPAKEGRRFDVVDQILQRVAELPDRTSPDDWPEAMLVTADELRQIITEELGL